MLEEYIRAQGVNSRDFDLWETMIQKWKEEECGGGSSDNRMQPKGPKSRDGSQQTS